MEWARLVLDYVDTLAWPLVVFSLVVFFALRFSGNIAQLIDRIREATGPGGFGVSFGEQVRAVQENAEAAELPSTPVIVGLQRPPVLGDVYEGPSDNYRGVVVDAWVNLEVALVRTADTLNLDAGKPPNVTGIVNQLEGRGVITDRQAEIIQSLRELRNEAAHAQEPLLDRTVVRAYVGMTQQVVALLEVIQEEVGGTDSQS